MNKKEINEVYDYYNISIQSCGKNKKVTHEAQPRMSLITFLPYFDIFCNLLQRSTATWNIFVVYD